MRACVLLTFEISPIADHDVILIQTHDFISAGKKGQTTHSVREAQTDTEGWMRLRTYGRVGDGDGGRAVAACVCVYIS